MYSYNTFTTTTTIYFNKVVFPSVLGLTSPMAFPQHSPPPSPVPSIFPTKSLLSHIFFQHFAPSLPGPTFHSITIYLQCLNSLYPTQLISPLNMTKPPQPVSSHDFSNVINCQHAPHTLITFLSLKHSCHLSQRPHFTPLHFPYIIYLCWPCLTPIQHCRSYACCIDNSF